MTKREYNYLKRKWRVIYKKPIIVFQMMKDENGNIVDSWELFERNIKAAPIPLFFDADMLSDFNDEFDLLRR